MSFRIEEKLFIKSENIFDFKFFLNKLKFKKFFPSRKIKSLYFDNKNYDLYSDSIEGLVPRKKIRIRHYPNNKTDSNYYLEIKNSSIEGRFKKRETIKNKKINNFIKYGIFDNQYGLCFPNIYVEYIREYLELDDVRFSIDTNINYIKFNSGYNCFDNNIIVELKCNINKNLDELTSQFPFQKIRFSKYCSAVESLNLKF